MSIQILFGTATKRSQSSSAIQLRIGNCTGLKSITVCRLTTVTPNWGICDESSDSAQLWMQQSEFTKVGTAIPSGASVNVTLKYDDAVPTEPNTRKFYVTEFDVPSCQILFYPKENAERVATV